MAHRPEMPTRTAARTPGTGGPGWLDRLDRVFLDVLLDRDGGDADVPADVDADQLSRASQPVDVAGFDAEPVRDLSDGKQLTRAVHQRSPSSFGRAWTEMD